MMEMGWFWSVQSDTSEKGESPPHFIRRNVITFSRFLHRIVYKKPRGGIRIVGHRSQGLTPLEGEIKIRVPRMPFCPMMAAAILQNTTVIENVPGIQDVF